MAKTLLYIGIIAPTALLVAFNASRWGLWLPGEEAKLLDLFWTWCGFQALLLFIGDYARDD